VVRMLEVTQFTVPGVEVRLSVKEMKCYDDVLRNSDWVKG